MAEKKKKGWSISERAADMENETSETSQGFQDTLDAANRVKTWGEEWRKKREEQKKKEGK